MWIKAAVLVVSGTGILFPNLVGLITIGLCSSLKQLAGYLAREEKDNVFDRLPDDILSSIVSRLKPKEASRTSVLSRRWRYIWTMMRDDLSFFCLDSLDIPKKSHDCVSSWEKQRFMNAINQSLQLHSSFDLKLKVFNVQCCFLNDDYTSLLLQWIQTLARLHVEELCLGRNCSSCKTQMLDRWFTFPFKLLDGFSNLWNIELSFCYLETSFVGQYNSLLTVDLSCIPLLGNQVSDILTSCPNLKYLRLHLCKLPLSLRIIGPNLKLVKLVLRACYNVQHLEIVSLPNARHILINIDSYVEILLSSVPKLEHLHLICPGMNHGFGEVQRNLPRLRALLIETSVHKIVHLPSTLHVFGNIRRLWLLTKRSSYPQALVDMDLRAFAGVMGACPYLESFHLQVGGPFCKRNLEQDAPWPVLRHEHLKVMELSGFSNTQNELEFAKFILASAQVLEFLRLVSASLTIVDGISFAYFHVKDFEKIDAEALCADLLTHAVSMCVEVEVDLL